MVMGKERRRGVGDRVLSIGEREEEKVEGEVEDCRVHYAKSRVWDFKKKGTAQGNIRMMFVCRIWFAGKNWRWAGKTREDSRAQVMEKKPWPTADDHDACTNRSEDQAGKCT